MTGHTHTRICRWVIRDGVAVCTAQGKHARPEPAAVPAPTARRRWFRSATPAHP